MKTFYSSGKLLLTGEYAVLDGALCLALPTVYGQNLKISPLSEPVIHWTSQEHDGTVWLEADIPISPLVDIKEQPISGLSPKQVLTQVLGIAQQLNPKFLSGQDGCAVVTQLDFPRQWGLGTSSTLINNIAQWADVDPYQLLWKTFGGSGYDIACAQNSAPLLYQLEGQQPRVRLVDFKPPFTNELFFVYLNRKQDSREAIRNYREHQEDTKTLVDQISALTEAILNCQQLATFESLLQEHEQILSDVLGRPTVKELLFPDYPGSLKSLGAWGGDFILAVGGDAEQEYFRKKGYTTLIPYDQMIA